MDRNGLVVLTDDIGTGKTTVVNALLNALDDNVSVAKINHTSLEPDQFLSLMARHRRGIVVGLAASSVTLLFSTWTIQALSVAEDPEHAIAFKRPKTAAAEPDPTFKNQVQKTTVQQRDMPAMDAAELASSPSKLKVQPAATTFKEEPLTGKDAATAPNSLPSVQVTPSLGGVDK